MPWIVLLTLSVSIELVSSSARVTSVKFQQRLSVTHLQTTRHIDRTRRPGSDKKSMLSKNGEEKNQCYQKTKKKNQCYRQRARMNKLEAMSPFNSDSSVAKQDICELFVYNIWESFVQDICGKILQNLALGGASSMADPPLVCLHDIREIFVQDICESFVQDICKSFVQDICESYVQDICGKILQTLALGGASSTAVVPILLAVRLQDICKSFVQDI